MPCRMVCSGGAAGRVRPRGARRQGRRSRAGSGQVLGSGRAGAQAQQDQGCVHQTRMWNFMRVGMKGGTWDARGGDVLWTDVGRGHGRRVLVPEWLERRICEFKGLRVNSGDPGGLGSTIRHA